jgi:hypothetical protein
MEVLRVSKLLAGGLAAISGAVVASRIGVEGTLTGAALTSIFVAVATALYSHSLTLAHGRMRCVLVRRAGGDDDTDQPAARPIRWQRVAAAAVVFVIAVGAITAVEVVAGQPLVSLFGDRPRPGASTSISVVASGQRESTPPATRAPGTPTTSPPGSVPTTTAPVGVPTTTVPATTVPTTTAVPTPTPGRQVPTTQRR